MMTLVLAVALTATTSAPDFGFKGCYGCYGCAGCYGCSGCYGCNGCYGGYVYAKPVYSGCWGGSGCFGGCFGGCYGGGYGCCGGCSGGCYGGCYGCWGGHHVAYAGCGGCCGSMAWAPTYGCCGSVIQAAPAVRVIEKAPGVPGMKKIEGEKKIEGDETSAQVIVRAPADVTVTVNGVRVARKSETETFRTPSLVSGTDYSYTIVATARRGGRDVTETRRVPVVAGGRAEVDFTALGSAATAAKVTIVADRDMAVRFNGKTVVVEGKRTFDTPGLEPGRSYFYMVEADVTKDGKTSTEKRRIEVEAGKAVTVDLRPATTVAAR